MIATEHKIEDLKEFTRLSEDNYHYYFPKKKEDQLCFSVWKENGTYKISTGYFIGVDWIEKNILHTQVLPKLNFNKEGDSIRDVDYIKMLISSLRHTETAKLISDLVIVKWNDPLIEIEQKQDMLTPFLMIDFLNVVKAIVKKGLKKSYYKTTKTLHSRIKGKMLIKQTINMHLSKGTQLHNVCCYDEFGIDNKENRLLKKAIEFIKKYMLASLLMKEANAVLDMLSFISPAFEPVSSEIEVNEIKQMKSNTLYQEYNKAIRLGKMILKRFGYNLSNTAKNKIHTPPFWIDMPMLFELHVLSLLKDVFKNDVNYHFTTYGNELDFLLKRSGMEMVIDAKYIPRWDEKTNHDNIRQVSGYARLKKVSDELGFEANENIDCLIIYPDTDKGIKSIYTSDIKSLATSIAAYNGIYKLGVDIPLIEE